MHLADYLAQHGPDTLAREVGCNPVYLRMVARGERRASAELAMRIERATGAAVPVEALRPDLAECWDYMRERAVAA